MLQECPPLLQHPQNLCFYLTINLFVEIRHHFVYQYLTPNTMIFKAHLFEHFI